MSDDGGGAPPPQVIRRADGSFQLLNIDLEPLSYVQRLGVGLQVWPQFRQLLETAGEYRERVGPANKPIVPAIGSPRDIDKHVAKTVRVAHSALSTVRPRLVSDTEMIQRMLNDEFPNPSEVMRASGYHLKMTIAEGRKSNAKHKNAYFGHGDKFKYAIEPFLQYARVWERKGFRYAHINSKEARKRLAKIEAIEQYLSKIKEDLEPRSHVATLRAPSEKSRRER